MNNQRKLKQSMQIRHLIGAIKYHDSTRQHHNAKYY